MVDSEGALWTGLFAGHEVRRYAPAVGVPVLRFHDLRHSHATQLLAANERFEFAGELPLGGELRPLLLDLLHARAVVGQPAPVKQLRILCRAFSDRRYLPTLRRPNLTPAS